MERQVALRGRIVLLTLALSILCAAGAFAVAATAAAQSAAAPQPAPSPTWAAVTADPDGMATATGAAVARGASGALYVAASGGATVGAPAHLILIKYDAAGVESWATPFAPASATQTGAVDVAVDKAGAVYVLGWTKLVSTGRDWLVVKFADKGDTGEVVWQRRVHGSGASSDAPKDLLVTASGRVWACGSLGRSGHGLDGAVVRFAAGSGEIVARRFVDDPAHRGDVFNALGVDKAGHLFAAGQYGQQTGGGKNGVMAAWTAAGDRLWVHTWGSKGRYDDPVNGLVVTAAGKAYAVGALGTPGGSSALIRQYNAAGRFIWQGTLTTETAGGTCSFIGAAPLTNGRIVAAGTFTSAKGNSNIVTVAFTAKGPSIWTRTYDTPHLKGTPSNDVARAVATDAAGHVFVAASTPFSLDGGSQIAVLRYSASGAFGWSTPALWDDGAKDSRAAGLTLAPHTVIVTGRTLRGGATDVATVAFPY